MTRWARVNGLSGENVVGDVPVVMLLCDIHDTAASWFSLVMSSKLWAGAVGWFCMFQM